MMRPLLLDLFCGAGGCSVGYHRAGFDVVGVDIEPRPRYPFEFMQDDAMRWLASGEYLQRDFAAIHASPPCQAYSVISKGMKVAHKHPDLLGPTRELLDKTGLPYVIENVPGAPMRADWLLCGTQFGLGVMIPEGGGTWLNLLRHRWFETNIPVKLELMPPCNHKGVAIWEHGKGSHQYVYPDGSGQSRRDIKAGGSITALDGGLQRVSSDGDVRRPGNDVRISTLGVYGNGTNKWHQEAIGRSITAEEQRTPMGIDWMSRKELSQAIPPAYTEWVGRRLLATL
jgi:DNA (cytosine-5)-methyltransferase 1